MNIGKWTGFAAFACFACLQTPGLASAQWRVHDLNPFNPDSGVSKSLREFDKERLNKMAGGFRAGRDYTKIYVKNETKNPISIAVIDIPFVVIQGNETVIDDPDESPWHVHAWYNLKPGERAHVSNTSNRNVYVYAQDGKGTKWEGKIKHEVPDGKARRIVAFNQHTFKDTPEEFTINFKP